MQCKGRLKSLPDPPLPLFVVQSLKIGVDEYNLKVGLLQNSDLRGISLSDNDIRLSSYRVKRWTMMTFVYHSGE